MAIKSFLYNKFALPILNQLKQGITPTKLAQSIALGFIMGCFPIIGPITPVCVFLTFIFKLNHVAVQTVNYAVYPLQIALLIPFYRMGESIFGVQHISLDVQEILNTFKISFTGALEKYLMTGLRGVVAWLIVSPFVYVMIYQVSYFFLKKVIKNEYNS